MKISITTPFVGKSFCFLEYAKTLETIVNSNPDIDFVWSVLDNSNKPSFEKRIKDTAKKARIKLYYGKEDTEGIKRVGMKRMQRVNDIYNELVFKIMPQDVDYCFVIEDDIAFDDSEAVRKCLTLMDADPLVATVTASTLARWHRGRFGKPQTSEYIGGFEKHQLITLPLALSGVRQVSTSAQGFWFTRMSILKELGLLFEVNGRHTTDGSWSENVRNHGYKIMLDQSIHCKHYYEREDGIMNYISPTHNAEGILGMAEIERIAAEDYELVQTDRKGSPDFIRINKNDHVFR